MEKSRILLEKLKKEVQEDEKKTKKEVETLERKKKESQEEEELVGSVLAYKAKVKKAKAKEEKEDDLSPRLDSDLKSRFMSELN